MRNGERFVHAKNGLDWLGKGTNIYLAYIHLGRKQCVDSEAEDGHALLFDVRPSSGPYTDQVVLPPANRLPPHLLS